MSEHQPPAGTPEYLEHGSGRPVLPAPGLPDDGTPGSRRRGHRSWWVGGGVLALLGLGAGAWAALSFFQQGAQPAEALPSSTVAYVSVDLDPAGGQKIDAFRTLNKFPAFKDEVGVSSVDDIRRKVGEAMLDDTGCTGLSYDHDIDPWLGQRAAFALVDLPSAEPDSVVVVQVRDEGKARDAFNALNSCNHQEPPAGFVVHDGWAVIADNQAYADKVAAATDQGTLAGDATYQRWTKAVGEAGVVNAYASPDAGRLLAGKFQGIFGGDVTADDPFNEALSSFKGGAATLRFTGDGVELALAGDGSSPQLQDFTGTTGGELAGRLPDDTAAAVSTTLKPGWLGRRLDVASGLFGSDISGDDAQRQLEQETGLTIPDDIETLLGSGFAISVSKDIDPEAFANSDNGTGLPIGATVKGDPAAIERVLDKLRAKEATDLAFLGSDSSGELEAIGPSAEYRKSLLDGGNLGGDDTFRSVVPDAEHASSVVYVNFDALEPAIKELAAGDQEDLANLTPLKAIGISTWTDDGVTRLSFKVSTN